MDAETAFFGDLIDWIEAQAEWREARADEYPADWRSRRVAVGLHRFARWLSEHTDDPRVDALRVVLRYDSLGGLLPGEELSRRVTHFGFDEAEDFDTLLSDMLEHAQMDGRDLIRREYGDGRLT